MTTYEVTAGNAYFWQKLAVQAADAEAAAEIFRAYLLEPAQLDAEMYELEQAELVSEDPEGEGEKSRANYRYRFKDDDIEGSDQAASATVKMIGSGGNG